MNTWWSKIDKLKITARQGFALPTVMIAGLLLLMIGTSALQMVSSSIRSINDQGWNGYAKQAADAGARYVEDCLRNSTDHVNPVTPWANTLTQSTDCTGTFSGANPTYVENYPATADKPAWRTTFRVEKPAPDLNSRLLTRVVGKLEILSAANVVVRTYTSQSTIIINVTGSQLGVQVVKVAHSTVHTCVLLSNSKVYCAGNSANGQVGQGAGTYSTPTDIAPFPPGVLPLDLVAFSFSDATGSTCIFGNDSQIYCIGYNNVGQFGNGYTVQNNPLFNPSTGTVRFGLTGGLTATSNITNLGTANYTTTCTIASDNNGYCAGANSNGQLGDNSTTNRNYPVRVPLPAGQAARKIIPLVETYTICTLTTVGEVYCKGTNTSGQMGTGNTTGSTSTTAYRGYASIVSEGPIVDFGGADEKTCALYTSGALYCAGRLPSASQGITSTPVRFGSTAALTFRDFSIGPTSICGVTTTDDGYCISTNASGELGTGNTTANNTAATPTKVAGDTGANYDPADPQLKLVRVMAGDKKICLFYNVTGSESSTGTLTCAGHNQYGQFGNGSSPASPYRVTAFGQPFILPTGIGVKEVYVNKGMTVTGSPQRQTTSEHSIVSDGGSWTPICVLGTNGTAYCAGRNNHGQLGDGTTTDRSTPVPFLLPFNP